VVKQKIDEFGIVTLVTGPRACGDGDQLDPVAADFDVITRVPLLALSGSDVLRERSI
jgi:hypothetical protein